MDEKDFRLQITREEFEKLNDDLFNRVSEPIIKALDAAGMTLDMMDQVNFSATPFSEFGKLLLFLYIGLTSGCGYSSSQSTGKAD